MMDQHKVIIHKLSLKYQVPEYVIEAIVKSPCEFIRYNSKDFTSVRIPNFGLFVVKPNRKKHIDERTSKNDESGRDGESTQT